MGLLKFIFYSLLFLLIKLGDLMYYVLSVPIRSASYLAYKTKGTGRKISNKRQNTIRRLLLKSFVSFSKNTLHSINLLPQIANFFKTITLASIKELLFVFTIVLTI